MLACVSSCVSFAPGAEVVVDTTLPMGVVWYPPGSTLGGDNDLCGQPALSDRCAEISSGETPQPPCLLEK